MYAVRDIEEIKERLLSFEKYAKDAQPDGVSNADTILCGAYLYR